MPRNTKTFAQITDFTRASPATYFDSTGTLQTAASGVARTAAYRFNSTTSQWVLAGLLVEGQATNALINNTMQGTVAGTPGTLPTGWAVGVPAGMSFSVVSVGVQNGIECFDIRISGTPTVTGNFQINPPSTPAAVNEVWTGSIFAALIAGTNPPGAIFNQNETSASSYLGGTAIVFMPTASLLRYSATRAIVGATANSTRGYIQANVTAGTAYDVTYRLGLPQLEKASFASSVIKTTTAAVTRSADALNKALGAEFNRNSQSAVITLIFDRNTADGIGGKIMYQWDDGTNNNRIVLALASSGIFQFQIVVGGSAVATVTANGMPVVAGTTYKVAFGFANGVARLVINGTAYNDAAPSSIPVATRRITGSNVLNGFITEANEYFGLMSIDQMKTLTV